MKRSDLMKQLHEIAKEQGVTYAVSEGGSHTKVHLGDRFVTVPRHREINELTARGILRDAKGD